MHPVLAASFANAVMADRTAPARLRAPKRGAATSGPVVPERLSEVVIRRAAPEDGPALARLGALDGNRAAGELLAYAAHVSDARDGTRGVLVAEVDGALEAALALDGGLAVADPFRPTAPNEQLLELRARQLGGELPRRGPGHLRVLQPRTS